MKKKKTNKKKNTAIDNLRKDLITKIERIPVNFFEGAGFKGKEEPLIRKSKVISLIKEWR